MQTNAPAYLTRDRAAEFLSANGIPTTKATLEQLAVRRRGPRFGVINNRAIYSRGDLLAWVEDRMRGNAA